MMSRVLIHEEFAAFLITWTTYGTWLPGDRRGWRSRTSGDMDPNLHLELQCASQMTAAPVRLNQQNRMVVQQSIESHCKVRAWELLAVNARSNHVHVVVRAFFRPQSVRDQLKANCTRMLRIAESPLIVEKTWTKGGDCRVLKDEQAVENAVRYVLDAQD